MSRERPESLEECEEYLTELLVVDNNWVKRGVASALGRVGSEDCIDELERLDLPEAEVAVEKISERVGA